MSKIKITINDQEIESLDQAIKLIQEAKNNKGLWRPEKGENYFFIEENGVNCFVNENDGTDQKIFEFQEVFPTRKGADKELDKRKALVRIKDYIAREGIEKEVRVKVTQVLYGLGYGSYEKEKIMANCESDLKILFEI